MSLLNFLFRDRASRKEANVATETPVAEPQASAPAPAHAESGINEQDTHQVSVHASLTDENGMPDLDEIRATLSKIAEIINDDEDDADHEEDQANLSTIEMTMGQLAEIADGRFKDGQPSADIAGTTVGVRIADLYDQLKTGKVVTTLARMLTEVPAELLKNPADGLSKEEVGIPLHLAVTSVRPDELMKRTASSEMEIGLKDMPNLFSMGGGAPTLKQPSAPEAGGDLFGPAPAPAAEPEPAPDPEPPAPVTRKVGPETTVKEPLESEKKADDELFSRAPLPTPKPATPEPKAADLVVQPPAPKPTISTPPSGGFNFEFNADATPFRRADDVPAEEEASVPEAAVEEHEQVVAEPAAAEKAVADELTEEVTPEPADDRAETVEEGDASTNDDAVLVAGIDLNRADADTITEHLEGVGSRLAGNIVRYREQHGAYTSVADLLLIPGVGPTTFERLSGETWPADEQGIKAALDVVLGDDADGYPDFRGVAERFCDRDDVTGCLIVHTDGHVLASAWDHDKSEILGAVAPQIFKKISPYVEQLSWGDVSPLTLVFGHDVVTLVQSDEVLLALVHPLDGLDGNQLRLVQLASAELEQRMERART